MVSIRPRVGRGLQQIVVAGFLAVCACHGGLVRAQDGRLPAAETRALQDQFEKRQAGLRTAVVEFSQTLSLAGMRNPAVSQGRILYASPGRLLVEYQKPAGDFVLLPGDETVVSRKGRRVAVTQKLDRMDPRTRRSLTLLLSLFEGKMPAGFSSAHIEARREGEHRVVVTISPDDTSGSTGEGVERVETTLARPSLDPVAVTIRLNGSAEMRYDFGRIERQVKLPPDTFRVPITP